MSLDDFAQAERLLERGQREGFLKLRTPDETAQGSWLNLVTKPGLSYVMAHIKFLRDGRYAVERIDQPRGKFSHTNWTGRGGDVASTTYTA